VRPAGRRRGEILPLAIGESVITRNHAFQHESGGLRLVALPHQVFVRLQPPHPNRKRAQRIFVLRMKTRMLIQLSDDDVVSALHRADRAEYVPAISTPHRRKIPYQMT
jgi:hypothetical protein